MIIPSSPIQSEKNNMISIHHHLVNKTLRAIILFVSFFSILDVILDYWLVGFTL